MNTLLAICIAALFSAWIYTLKQEVDYLHKRVMSARGKTTGRSAEKAGTPSDTAHTFTSAVKTRSAGIPTWTIE